jgi:hypothetical protein
MVQNEKRNDDLVYEKLKPVEKVIYQKVFEIVMMILMLTSMQTTETTLYGI